jgi:hypothetical protein
MRVLLLLLGARKTSNSSPEESAIATIFS